MFSLQEGGRELVWILEHPTTYTAGIRSENKDILDKSIKILKTIPETTRPKKLSQLSTSKRHKSEMTVIVSII